MTSTVTEPTPLDPTGNCYAPRLFGNGRTPRRELWGARSADGVWLYHREDSPGTPWTVVHVPTSRAVHFESSLDQARMGTADGRILAEMDRQARPRPPGCQNRDHWTDTLTGCLHTPLDGDTLCRQHRDAADLAALFDARTRRATP
jgi:hypothetical protein